MTPARQGHLYRFGDERVIALAAGEVVPVAEIKPDQMELGARYDAHASCLKPLPMRYFQGKNLCETSALP